MLALKNSGNCQSCVILKPEYNIFDAVVLCCIFAAIAVCQFVWGSLLVVC